MEAVAERVIPAAQGTEAADEDKNGDSDEPSILGVLNKD
jgi:hypothetical protein